MSHRRISNKTRIRKFLKLKTIKLFSSRSFTDSLKYYNFFFCLYIIYLVYLHTESVMCTMCAYGFTTLFSCVWFFFSFAFLTFSRFRFFYRWISYGHLYVVDFILFIFYAIECNVYTSKYLAEWSYILNLKLL